MAKSKNHKATPFLGTKIFVQTGLGEAMTVTEATLSPATITIANNKLKADDMIMLSGLGELDGRFPVDRLMATK